MSEFDLGPGHLGCSPRDQVGREWMTVFYLECGIPPPLDWSPPLVLMTGRSGVVQEIPLQCHPCPQTRLQSHHCQILLDLREALVEGGGKAPWAGKEEWFV